MIQKIDKDYFQMIGLSRRIKTPAKLDVETAMTYKL